MSRKTERDTARDEDPHSEVPDWLEELLEGKSDRERSKILREYRDEVMCARSNPRSLRKLKPELESSGWPAASWVHTPTGSIISHMDDGHWAVSNRAGKPVREFKTAAEAVQFVSTHRNPVKPRRGESERSFVSRCMSEEKSRENPSRGISKNRVEIEYSQNGNLKRITVPQDQFSKTLKNIISMGAVVMKVMGFVPDGETLSSYMKKIRRGSSSDPRRNPYVESGAYIVADSDINRQASKMG